MRGQPRDSGFDLRREFVIEQMVRGIGGWGRPEARAYDRLSDGLLRVRSRLIRAVPSPKPAPDELAPAHPHQPGAAVGPESVGMPVAEGLAVRFLHQIRRVVGIPRETKGQGLDRRAVGERLLLERLPWYDPS